MPARKAPRHAAFEPFALKLLTPTEVASDYLRCSPRTLANLVRDRRIEIVREGKRVFFRPSAIAEYLARCAVPPLPTHAGKATPSLRHLIARMRTHGDIVSNLQAHYTFNSNGDDSSGNGRHLEGGPQSYIAGPVGNAASSPHFTSTAHSYLHGDATYAVACWCRVAGATAVTPEGPSNASILHRRAK